MKKKLQNNFTTPEQSKRLLELGVPANSADCYYDQYQILNFRNELDYGYDFFGLNFRFTPCWSVGRLMEINDICTMFDDKAWMGLEYPSTKLVKDKFALPYIEFLIQAIEVATDVLDFSKLNDE